MKKRKKKNNTWSTWSIMSGINYYGRMKEIFDSMEKNGPEGDSVRKTDFLNRFIRDQGLNVDTGKRKFNEAVDIQVIFYVGRDDLGCELIRVV